MRLVLDNIAKIKHADIQIDGITVIAGENNTGKSTVGKALYASFQAMYDLNHRIKSQKQKELLKVCNQYVPGILVNNRKVRINVPVTHGKKDFIQVFTKRLSSDLTTVDLNQLDRITVIEKIRGTVELIFPDLEEGLHEGYLEEFSEKILNLYKSDDYKVSTELISRVFQRIFDSQIGGLQNSYASSFVRLNIKNKDLILTFTGNACTSKEAEIDILHEAFFVDDPFIIDDLYDNSRGVTTSTKAIRQDLAERLRSSDNNIMDGIFDAVAAKDNLSEIYKILNEVTPGNILIQDGVWQLKTDDYPAPLNVENLSTGLKSFVVVKMLLEKGILKEKDVLILDEPEIHLHPDWQLKYAEIIVLLQKKFDLTILVTTHSRDFLEAIELYSKKYDMETKCHYYLSRLEDEAVTFEEVTGGLEKIYRQMVTASMLLDQLRYDLAEEDE